MKLSVNDGDPFEDVTLYRSTVGALHNLTITWLDIAFSVNKVCQFMQHPLYIHWKAVKHILCYLIGTLDLGVNINPSTHFHLIGYCHPDWVSDIDDRRSTSEYCWFLGNIPVSRSRQS